MTADQRRRTELEKTVLQVDPEVRRAMQREQEEVRVNLFA